MKDAVLAYLLTVPKGNVVTYGQIAEAVGHPKAARAVGNILHRNPDPQQYPCYKVVDAQGRLSEQFAFGGIEGQRIRLEQDGIEVKNGAVSLAVYGLPRQKP